MTANPNNKNGEDQNSHDKTPFLVIVVLCLVTYGGCVFLEVYDKTRYDPLLMGNAGVPIGAGAYLIALATIAAFWLRQQKVRILCLLSSLLVTGIIFGTAGYVIEQKYHHAAWHPEKIFGDLFFIACLSLAVGVGAISGIAGLVKNLWRTRKT